MRNDLKDILTAEENLKDYYHIYYKDPDKFRIVPGHKILIKKIATLLTNKKLEDFKLCNCDECKSKKLCETVDVVNKKSEKLKSKSKSEKLKPGEPSREPVVTVTNSEPAELSEVQKYMDKVMESLKDDHFKKNFYRKAEDKIVSLINLRMNNYPKYKVSVAKVSQENNKIVGTVQCLYCKKFVSLVCKPNSAMELHWNSHNFVRHFNSHKVKQEDPSSASTSLPIEESLNAVEINKNTPLKTKQLNLKDLFPRMNVKMNTDKSRNKLKIIENDKKSSKRKRTITKSEDESEEDSDEENKLPTQALEMEILATKKLINRNRSIISDSEDGSADEINPLATKQIEENVDIDYVDDYDIDYLDDEYCDSGE